MAIQKSQKKKNKKTTWLLGFRNFNSNFPFFLWLYIIARKKKEKKKAKIIPFTYPPELGTMSLGDQSWKDTFTADHAKSEDSQIYSSSQSGLELDCPVSGPFSHWFDLRQTPSANQQSICPWLWIDASDLEPCLHFHQCESVLSVNQCESVGSRALLK
jgi:hypothetical protein